MTRNERGEGGGVETERSLRSIRFGHWVRFLGRKLSVQGCQEIGVCVDGMAPWHPIHSEPMGPRTSIQNPPQGPDAEGGTEGGIFYRRSRGLEGALRDPRARPGNQRNPTKSRKREYGDAIKTTPQVLKSGPVHGDRITLGKMKPFPTPWAIWRTKRLRELKRGGKGPDGRQRTDIDTQHGHPQTRINETHARTHAPTRTQMPLQGSFNFVGASK